VLFAGESDAEIAGQRKKSLGLFSRKKDKEKDKEKDKKNSLERRTDDKKGFNSLERKSEVCFLNLYIFIFFFD